MNLKPGDGHAYAAGIRADVERVEEGGEWGGFTRQCTGCQRFTMEHLEDGECWQCRHPGEDPMGAEERRQAVEELHRVSVSYLRRKAEEHAQKATHARSESDAGYHGYLAKTYADEAKRLEESLQIVKAAS